MWGVGGSVGEVRRNGCVGLRAVDGHPLCVVRRPMPGISSTNTPPVGGGSGSRRPPVGTTYTHAQGRRTRSRTYHHHLQRVVPLHVHLNAPLLLLPRAPLLRLDLPALAHACLLWLCWWMRPRPDEEKDEALGARVAAAAAKATSLLCVMSVCLNCEDVLRWVCPRLCVCIAPGGEGVACQSTSLRSLKNVFALARLFQCSLCLLWEGKGPGRPFGGSHKASERNRWSMHPMRLVWQEEAGWSSWIQSMHRPNHHHRSSSNASSSPIA